MKLSCTLKTDASFLHLQKLFATELSRKHDRSSITLEEEHGKAVFLISATDTTALRAAINTVTSVLGMYEKTTEATNDHT
jgi:tRNA threonylcarbamoyladenosine modification (KEOPS) complex  Pcc1 subunit